MAFIMNKYRYVYISDSFGLEEGKYTTRYHVAAGVGSKKVTNGRRGTTS